MFQKIFWVLVGVLVLIFIIISVVRPTPVIDVKADLPPAVMMAYPSEYNFRQTPNACGPYNTAAVVRTLSGQDVSSEEFARAIDWKIPRFGTHPFGLEKQLEKHGIHVESYSLRSLAKEERIIFLKQQLAEKRPVILLVERHGYEHYVTLFGYDHDVFFIYDSAHDRGSEGMTKDDNGVLPGNITLSSDTLLAEWAKGGVLGFYTWYALVGSL
ncbi:MAG: hypothetical protein AAB408_03950 [Patescibacteria group bacterium]